MINALVAGRIYGKPAHQRWPRRGDGCIKRSETSRRVANSDVSGGPCRGPAYLLRFPLSEQANPLYDGVDLFVPIFSELLGTHRYGRFGDSRRQLRIEALQLGCLFNSDLSISDHTAPLVTTAKS